MSEVYWIAGAQNWEASQGIDAWLARIGLKPTWIDEIFWLSSPGAPVFSNLPDRSRQWDVTAATAHRLLQLILSDLLCGKNDFVVLVESRGQTISLAALATPQAVGRYNLLPAGRLAALSGLHQGQPAPEIVKAVMANLAEFELEPESVSCLASANGSGLNLTPNFTQAQLLKLPGDAGLVESILALRDALKNQPAKTGLLFYGESSLATLLEVL